MKYLIVSDIHSNLEALEAVLKEAKKYEFDRLLSLGDSIGYGANPNECLELLREFDAGVLLMGNHEAAVAGQMEISWFAGDAAESVIWTKEHLSENNLKFLQGMPRFFSMNFLVAVHGTPMNPLKEYMNADSAKIALERVPEDLVLCGHNHVPFSWEQRQGMRIMKGNSGFSFSGKRMVFSAPSAGQPRDGDKRAGFAVLDFDSREIIVRRVDYDIEKAAKKILDAGLPAGNAERLKSGE